MSEQQQKVRRWQKHHHFCTSIIICEPASLKEDMHAHGPAHKHIQMCTHTCAQYAHMPTHGQMCAHMHTHAPHIHVQICAYMCVHSTHPCTHIHMCTHIRIHTNTDAGFCTSEGSPSSSTNSSTDTAIPAGWAPLQLAMRTRQQGMGLTQASQVCDCPKQLHSLQALQGLLPGGNAWDDPKAPCVAQDEEIVQGGGQTRPGHRQVSVAQGGP